MTTTTTWRFWMTTTTTTTPGKWYAIVTSWRMGYCNWDGNILAGFVSIVEWASSPPPSLTSYWTTTPQTLVHTIVVLLEGTAKLVDKNWVTR